MGPMNSLRRFFLLVALSLGVAAPLLGEEAETKKADAEFEKMAVDFISGYLSARPLQGVALGYHQYDGKIGDFSRLAIDAEVERLKRFQDQLAKIDASKLSKSANIDRRILQTAIARELFRLVEMSIFEKNPMIYAGALDVSIYIKRDFKPLEDRVRDIVTIEDQAANIMTAAKTNLLPALPKPYVELAIQIANGSADFMEKELAAALKDVKDEALMSAFRDANQKATAALRDYAVWLTKEKMPKAMADFALGAENYQKMLAGTELVDLAAGQGAGDWVAAFEGGTADLRRRRQNHRSKKAADRSFQTNPKRTSETGGAGRGCRERTR